MKKYIFFGLVSFVLSISNSFSNEQIYNEGFDSGYRKFFRVDCRFHNIEHNPDVSFCTANADYIKEGNLLNRIHLVVKCDDHTLCYKNARLQKETTLDRFSPENAATPALEIFPQGQLATEGTYTSQLDTSLGRFKGLCYVQRTEYDTSDPDDLR